MANWQSLLVRLMMSSGVMASRRRFAALAVAVSATALLALPVAGAGAATPSGVLFGFGLNFSGELGNTTKNKTTEPNPAPTPVTLPGEAGAVTQTSSGGQFSLAVTASGQLFAFGDNHYGQLGNTTNSGTSTPNPTPTRVRLPGQVGGVTQIAAGYGFSLVLTASDQLYGFGNNDSGELGNTTNNGTNNGAFIPNPHPVRVGLPGQNGTITQIAAGYDHTLVVTSSGQLYAFGYNGSGDLGNPVNDDIDVANPTPKLVTLPGQVGGVTQAAAGGFHSLVLTASGQLYAFGENIFGQLGIAATSGTEVDNPTPALVTLPGAVGGVSQIATGYNHSLAVTSSGQLYAFGDNRFGQLGTATNNGADTANPTPARVTLPGQVGAITQIAAGYGHSLVVTSGGQLFVFGDNLDGQLGSSANSGTVNANPTPRLVKFPSGTKIDAVGEGPGSYHSLAIVAGPPTLTAITLSHSRWREPKSKRSAAPIGTTFSLTLSEGAKVSFAFTEPLGGRRVGGKCVGQTANNRHRAKCTRAVTRGTLSVTEASGRDKLAFQGRAPSKQLAPGRYTLVITATNAAGQQSKPHSVSFTITT
jgi:alpha-tubulin suppressor-like RCC1 family protein